VRILLESVRQEMGLDVHPLDAYYKSGYENEKLKRGTGGKGWA
jgi:hypothetical protein